MNSINSTTPQINAAPVPPPLLGQVPAEKKEPEALNNGYIYELKTKLSHKASDLVNRLVTRQVEKRMLRCLPPEVKEDVQTNIEGTIQNMVEDITSKSFDTGLNILKATPAVGNAVSALSAADNVLAGIKNTKQSVTKITDQINKVQNEFNNQYNKINALAPQIGGDGKIVSNNLQTIIDRAHHSIAQHRGDVHHLIEHHNSIHKYSKKNTRKNNSQMGGQIKTKTNTKTNKLHTILSRASHSVAQHHGDLVHHVIIKRTSKSIRDFHNTTKRLRRSR
jgi:hypothetical protein